MARKRKNKIDVPKARKFLFEAYGLKTKEVEPWELMVIHEELRAKFHWYHTTGKIAVVLKPHITKFTMHEHLKFFTKKGYHPTLTSNEVGIRMVKGPCIFIWYPNTGTLMIRNNVGQKKVAVSTDRKTIASIMAGHAG